MPSLDFFPCNGRVYKEEKLRRTVEELLRNGKPPSDAVIALTDVYTGTKDFTDATDAKRKMREWVGINDRFHPHAAQHDFEAWLLPYWPDIQKLAGHKMGPPPGQPESVNHNRPPSHYVKEIFRAGTARDDYSKVRDAGRILRGKDLTIAANLMSGIESVSEHDPQIERLGTAVGLQPAKARGGFTEPLRASANCVAIGLGGPWRGRRWLHGRLPVRYRSARSWG